MKALIFAAGLGTRLYPYTSNRPKALVPISGTPMLQHIILKLKKFGINEFYINVHHFSDQIIHFLQANNNFNCKINISNEKDELLDTGGGLKKVLDMLSENENILVHNVDIWTNYDLSLLIKQHIKSEALATMLVQKRNTSRYLLFHPQEKQLKGWMNNKTNEKIPNNIITDDYKAFAFNGIHIVNSKARTNFPDNRAFPLIPVYLNLAKKYKIVAHEIQNSYWLDLGKPEQIIKAEKLLLGDKKEI